MSRKLFAIVLSAIPFFVSFATAQDKPVIWRRAVARRVSNLRSKRRRSSSAHRNQKPGRRSSISFRTIRIFSKLPRPTTRMGIDGKWVGATHANSYSYFSVDPGVRHLCASWQPTDLDHGTAALHFLAEAGGIYFFTVKNRVTSISFVPSDSDEGQFLINRLALSTSRPK